MSLPIGQVALLTTLGIPPTRWTNVTPFTYQDGRTHAKMQEELLAYVVDTLIPETNSSFSILAEEFAESIAIIAQMFLDNSAVLQDPILANIIEDEDSESRNQINALLAQILTPKVDVPGVYTLFAPVVNPGESEFGTPDPLNPGFWLD